VVSLSNHERTYDTVSVAEGFPVKQFRFPAQGGMPLDPACPAEAGRDLRGTFRSTPTFWYLAIISFPYTFDGKVPITFLRKF
jgi:hypothetical protein